MSREGWPCADGEAGDPETCRLAILTLLHALPKAQRRNAFRFCLDDLERLYRSARCAPPPWINILRASEQLR